MDTPSNTGNGGGAPPPTDISNLTHFIEKMDWCYRRFLQAACVALFITMLVAIGFQVIMRYAFNNPLVWSEELARFCMIWLSFLAAALAMREGQHITLSGIFNFSGKLKTIIGLLTTFAVIGVLIILGWQGVLMTLKTARQISPALGFSMSWVFVCIPLSAVLMGVGMLLRRLTRFHL